MDVLSDGYITYKKSWKKEKINSNTRGSHCEKNCKSHFSQVVWTPPHQSLHKAFRWRSQGWARRHITSSCWSFTFSCIYHPTLQQPTVNHRWESKSQCHQ